MGRHKHRRQRRWHELRYGPRHWFQHQRGVGHSHRKRRSTASSQHRDHATPASTTSGDPGGATTGSGPGTPAGATPESTYRVRKRPARSNSKGRRRRRIIGVGVLAILVILVALAISAVYSILKARSDLQAAKAQIDQVTTNPNHVLSHGERARTLAVINRVAADVRTADHTLSTSPGVDFMWVVPYLHTQRQVLFNLISDIEATTTSGRALLHSVNTLVNASHGTSVSIPALQALHHQVVLADARIAPLGHPSGGILPLLPPLSSAQGTIDRDLQRLSGLLGDGRQLTSYAMAFLGADGPRTYFLAAENNAEMRDQGAILSYALMQTDGGTFTVNTPASVATIPLPAPANVAMPPGTRQAFAGFNPTQIWQSANAPAGFPWSGTDVQAMYAQAAGQRVDGVIGLDVPGLANLLKIIGPVQVPGISEPVTAGNLAYLTLDQLYQGLSPSTPEAARHELLASVAKAAVDQMRGEHVDLAAFANALAKDVAGRHLVAWDSVPSYEATIARFGASGAVDRTDPARTFHVAVEDGSANKLDYYVGVSLSEHVVLAPSGAAEVTTTVTGTNHAPAGVGPSYQFGPDNVVTHVPGQYVGLVYLWGPRGASQAASVRESGLTLSNATINLLPQQSQSVQFFTVIPRAVVHGHLHLVFVPQPRLSPEQLHIHVMGNGWHVDGPATVSTALTKTMGFSWSVSQ